MYNALLKDHRSKSAATRKQVEGLKAASLQSCELVTAHLFSEVQSGVGALYRNQRVLQSEASTLQANTARFVRSSDKWLALSASLNTALKELGDVQNWALTIQKDVRWIDRELAEVVAENNDRKNRLQARRQSQLEAEEERRRKAGKATNAAAPAAAAAAAVPSPQHHEPQHGADEELP